MTAPADDMVPGFAFTVGFGSTNLRPDCSFQEVSGINSIVEMEAVPEGGENRYVLQLPKGTTHTPLELKRGIAAAGSTLVQWCRVMMEGGLAETVRTTTLTVSLVDGARQPLRTWEFADVYPVKWEIEPFNAGQSTLAIEKIVLNYSYLQRTK
jgi:phage tail-like protein